MDRAILITPEEGMLIDWVLTMHTYDSQRYEQLLTPFASNLRKKIAPYITVEKESPVNFSFDEINYLLITVPITFRFYKEDVGFSLKKKLLATQFPPQIIWEVKNEAGNQGNSNKDDHNNNTKDMS